MSYRGKHFSAGFGSVDLGRKYLAPEVSECLVRERFCVCRKPIRRANSGAGVQARGEGIEERKRVRGALFTRARLAGDLPQSDQQGDVVMHGKASDAPKKSAPPQCGFHPVTQCEMESFKTFSFLSGVLKHPFPAPYTQGLSLSSSAVALPRGFRVPHEFSDFDTIIPQTVPLLCEGGGCIAMLGKPIGADCLPKWRASDANADGHFQRHDR
jgi:hypothetical protein